MTANQNKLYVTYEREKRRLARLFLEIDGKEIKTDTVGKFTSLPRMGISHPIKCSVTFGSGGYYYKTVDGQIFKCKTDNPITRYWKWENEQ